MALKLSTQKNIVVSTTEEDGGVTSNTETVSVDNAYIAVAKVNSDKNYCYVTLIAYEDSTKERIVWRKMYKFHPEFLDGSPNLFKQAYEYIKTLPEYASAEDC